MALPPFPKTLRSIRAAYGRRASTLPSPPPLRATARRSTGARRRVISQLRARGIITPEQDGSYQADATRVAYIRNLRAHVVPAASATLTEERAKLLRARRERMELETARMVRRLELEKGGTVTSEELDRQLETIIARLEDIPAGYANSIAEAARRADSIIEANAAVGTRLRSAINEALGIVRDVTNKRAA